MSQSVDNLAGNLKLISLQFATIQLPAPPFFYCRLPLSVSSSSQSSSSNRLATIESKSTHFSYLCRPLSHSHTHTHTHCHSFHLFCRSCTACASNWPRMMQIMTPRESLPNRVQRRIAYAGAALSPISRSAFCSSTMSQSTGERRYPAPLHLSHEIAFNCALMGRQPSK